jgi:sugar lactone lactonase YvrE
MDTTYSIIVRAVDQYGSITASDAISAKTLFSLPAVVTNLVFTNVGNTTALLSWSGGDYATSYTIVVTSVTTGTIVTPSISTYLTNGNLAVNSAQFSGLLAGFTYSVTLQAVNSFGSSSVSSAATVTTTVLVTTFASGLLGPTAITSDGTNLYVAQAPSSFSQDTADNIMRIDSAGNVTPIVTGSAKATIYNAGKTAITTQGGVFGITYVPSRSPPLIFTDSGNHVIKACETDGTNVTTILGSGVAATVNGTGTVAAFIRPYFCTSDSNGNLYISTGSVFRKANLNNLTSTLIEVSSDKTTFVIDIVNDVIWTCYENSGVDKYKLSPPSPVTLLQRYSSSLVYYSAGQYAKSGGITMDMYGNIIIAYKSFNKIKLIYNYERSFTYNGITLTANKELYNTFRGTTEASTANNVIDYAGSGVAGSTDDTLLNSTFDAPWGVHLSADNTILYVTENGSGKVRAMPYMIHTILSSLPPTAPTNIVQVTGPPYELTISWSGVIQETSYTYLIKDASDNTLYPGVATLVTDSFANKTASFSGLTYGQTYSVTVTAINVNGPASSTISLIFEPFTYLIERGTASLFAFTVDSSNNICATDTLYLNQNYVYNLVTYSSGVKTSVRLSAATVTVGSYYTKLVYSSDRNLFLITTTDKTLSISPSGTVTTIPSLKPFSGIDSLGRLYTFETTYIGIYNISNIYIGKLSSLLNDPPESLEYREYYSNILTIDAQNNVYIVGKYRDPTQPYSSLKIFINKFNTYGEIVYTWYELGRLELEYNNNNIQDISLDKYGNLMILTSAGYYLRSRLYIVNLSTTSFTYNGITYAYGDVITYAYMVQGGSSSSNFIHNKLPNISISGLRSFRLDNTGTILFMLDGAANIISIPYLISKLPPTPIINPVIKSGTPSTITIEWTGGIPATSYSYTFTDLNGNALPIYVSTDNGITNQNVVLSGNFHVDLTFNLGITATNEYSTPSNTQTFSFPISITGFVSTFTTGLASPWGIAFDNNNILYVAQEIFSGTVANPNLISIASDGVTKTTIVLNYAKYPTGLAYNPVLGLLMLMDTQNNRIFRSGLSPGVPTLLPGTMSYPRGGIVDSYGNTYVAAGNQIIKITRTYVQTTHITQATGGFNAPNDITIDPFGNLWVADGTSIVKKFTNAGVLLESYTGFNVPQGITSDKVGNIIVADTSNNVIKIIYTYPTTQTLVGVTYTAVTSGLCNVYTYAGRGLSGSRNAELLTSTFNKPRGIRFDNTGSVLYFSDFGNGTFGNGRICSMPYNLSNLDILPPTQPMNIVAISGTLSTFSFSWSGVFGATYYTYTATDSDLNPVSINVITDNGVSDQNVTLEGTLDSEKSYIFTITANNAGGSRSNTFTHLLPTQPIIVNTAGSSSSFSFSWTGVIRAYYYLYSVTDSDMNPVSINVIADNGISAQNVTLEGTFDISKSYIFTIRPINPGGSTPGTLTTGVIKEFVTNYKTGLSKPTQITFGPSNTLYFSQFDGNNVLSILSDGTLTIIATTFLARVYGVSYDFMFNRLIIVDNFNNRVATTPLTGGTPTYLKTLIYVRGCVCDTFGNSYFTPSNSNHSNQLVKLRGSTLTLFSPGYTNANGITLDPFDNFWVANTTGNTVVKHDSTGTVLATYTGFNAPSGLCSDYLGNIIVADSSNNVIKIIYTHSTPITINDVTYTAGNVYTYAGSGTAGNTVSSLILTKFNNPWSTQLDLTNTTLYVCDYGNNSIRSMPYLLNSTPLSIETYYAPIAVTFNAPTGLTSTGFTINWTPGKYTNSYTYSFSTSAGTVTPTIINNGISGNNIVVSGLTNATQYTITITSANNFSSLTASSTRTVYTEGVINYRDLNTLVPAPIPTYMTIDTNNTLYFVTQYSGNGYRVSRYVGESYIELYSYIGEFDATIIMYGLCIYNGIIYNCYSNGQIGQHEVTDVPNSPPPTLFATIPSPDYGIYICLDPVNPGSFYVYTNLGAIYKIDLAGNVTLFANATTLDTTTYGTDKSIAADNLGNIYYTNTKYTYYRINKINQQGTVSTLALGPTGNGISANGMKFTSNYSTLYAVYAQRIYKYVVSTNTWTFFAGNGATGNTNSNLLTSTFTTPYDLAIDSTGNLMYVSDSGKKIRLITFN